MRNKLIALATLGLAALGFFAVPAGAQTADPTGGAGGDILDQSTAWVTGQGVPLIVGLLVIGIVVSLLVKFAKRGARSA